MWHLLLLFAGFLPLIIGANLLVDNASSLAKRLNIPSMVIGLTIVGFGTSSPELVVNLFASLGKNSDLALGNIVGSNIFNILGILGISAIVYPLAVKKNTTWIEIPLCLLSAVIIILLANDMIIDKMNYSVISRIDGCILLLFFLIFLSYNITLLKAEQHNDEILVKDKPVFKSVFLILTGLVILIVGGRIIVVSAVKVASAIGLSQRIIALTIVSIGTSLPELATSVIASRKKNVDIAIGNIVGSNIFNAFFILGISAVIHPVSLLPLSNIDMILNIFASLILFLFIFTGKGRRIGRKEGILFILVYIIYIGFLIIV
jgi:cation:H+ antiporter